MLKYRYKFHLVDKAIGHRSGPLLTGTGGVVYVALAGDPTKAAIQDRAGNVLSNPLALTAGGAEFYSNEASVDLFIQTPGSYFVVAWKVVPDKVHEIPVDRYNPFQTMVVPVSVTNQAGDAQETDSQFDFAVGDLVLPTPSMRVVVADPTETIDVGLKASESGGNAQGFIDDLSVGTVGFFRTSLTNGAYTAGPLLRVQTSGTASDLAPACHAITTGQATSVTWTLSAGSDTAKAYVYLPYMKTPYLVPQL